MDSSVVPAYNAAEDLEACLSAVRFKPTEIIKVDDSSTDETATIARRMRAPRPSRYRKRALGLLAADPELGAASRLLLRPALCSRRSLGLAQPTALLHPSHRAHQYADF